MFPYFGYCEQCCYEYLRTSICLSLCSVLLGIYLGEDKLLIKLIEENIVITLNGLSLYKQNLKTINHEEIISLNLIMLKLRNYVLKRIP